MSEDVNTTERKIIKIGVIMQYGDMNAELVAKALLCENTEEKLDNIVHIIEDTTMTPEQQLFVVQKLLAYPKSARHSISSQIMTRLRNKGVSV